MVGLAKTLAKEGVKYNITANVIAPIAASAMTATIWPPELLKNIKPEHVAPVVAFLCHDSCKETGQVFESGAGYTGLGRWEEGKGAIFRTDKTFTPSAVAARWGEVVNLTDANHPKTQDDIDRDVRLAGGDGSDSHTFAGACQAVQSCAAKPARKAHFFSRQGGRDVSPRPSMCHV
jgi:hypothetical protein